MTAPEQDRAAARRSARRALRSFLWRARPWAAAALVAVAVLVGLRVLAPTEAATTSVVVATTSLAAGHRVTASDVTTAAMPTTLTPEVALPEVGSAVGQVLAAPVPRGAVITSGHLATTGWALLDGELAVPVRLADPRAAALVPPGTVAALVEATGQGARVLTESGRILAQLEETPDSTAFGLSGNEAPPLLLVAVPQAVATLVLDVSAAGTLSVALGPGGRDTS